MQSTDTHSSDNHRAGRPRIFTDEERAARRKEYAKKYYQSHSQELREKAKMQYQKKKKAAGALPAVKDAGTPAADSN